MPIRVHGASGPPAAPQPARPDVAVPDVSVIVPTAGRPEAIERLLRGLARQSVSPKSFEVLVTDDGTEPPVAPQLAKLELPFELKCEWQPRSGPAAARNRAIAKARAPLLLILNDDAGPPPDLIERHLAAHARSTTPRAWLGGFDFAPECRTPFAMAVTCLGLVFPFHAMKRAAPNPGRFFWTCNLSVPTRAVLEAGGFDASFSRPICEDVELGHRLEQRGLTVWYLEDAACLHHHVVDVHWFMKRQVELGQWMVRMFRKHDDPRMVPWLDRAKGDLRRFELSIEVVVRTRAARAARAARAIDAIDRKARELSPDDPAHANAVATIAPRLDDVNVFSLALGILAGLRGWSASEARRRIVEPAPVLATS